MSYQVRFLNGIVLLPISLKKQPIPWSLFVLTLLLIRSRLQCDFAEPSIVLGTPKNEPILLEDHGFLFAIWGKICKYAHWLIKDISDIQMIQQNYYGPIKFWQKGHNNMSLKDRSTFPLIQAHRYVSLLFDLDLLLLQWLLSITLFTLRYSGLEYFRVQSILNV